MRTKVAHLVYSFGVGGLERVIANLVNETGEAVEHHIITQTPDQSFADRLSFPVHFHCLDKQDGWDIASHKALYRVLREIKPNALHTYNFGTLEYQLTAFLARVPVRVHAEHGRESSYKKIANPKKYEWFRRILSVFVDNFVVVSKDLYEWAQQKLKLRPPKLQLIYNGIDIEAFEDVALEKAAGDEFTFIAIGRLVDVKNHSLLIDAFSKLLQSHAKERPIKLLIAGDGPNREALARQIDTLGLSEKVYLLGNVDDVAVRLKSSDAFVLSSRYEAQPMTALEAMAASCPVIATEVGGVGHVLSHENNSLLVPSENSDALAQAMAFVIENPSQTKLLTSQAKEDVESHFSVRAMSQRYMSLYQQSK